MEALVGMVVAAGVVAGLAMLGVSVSMRQSYAHSKQPVAPPLWPPAAPVPAERVPVAIVLGASGSVIGDVLGPYETLARSTAFAVYTVAVERSLMVLSGGLEILPDYSFADVDAGRAPAPCLVVVPAVVSPRGASEAPLRAWLARRADLGASILGVCAGVALLAEAGLLEGRRATSHWANLPGLKRRHPAVDWIDTQRYVEDGAITTTAGVTSGIIGALRLVEQFAGAEAATRVGREIAYPDWSVTAPATIVAHRRTASDVAIGLNVAFPWMRPRIAVGLQAGAGEIEVAAAFEALSATSFAAKLEAVDASDFIRTRHGATLATRRCDRPGSKRASRLVQPGAPDFGSSADRCAFDAWLVDLASTADRSTARATAKMLEYPTAHLRLRGRAWPMRATAQLLIAITAGAGLGYLASRAVG